MTTPSTRDGDAAARAALPAGRRIYAVGDIHGRADLLDRLHDMIATDLAARPITAPEIIYLEDYIDLGMDSRGILDRLARGGPAGLPARHLKGNHEDFLLRFLDGDDRWHPWLCNGSEPTFISYGVSASGTTSPAACRARLIQAMPRRHLDFLRRLKPRIDEGGYVFVHAGVRPGDFGAVVVHGHSPTADGRPESLRNRICVDTGAYFSNTLTCAVLEGHKRRFLNI